MNTRILAVLAAALVAVVVVVVAIDALRSPPNTAKVATVTIPSPEVSVVARNISSP